MPERDSDRIIYEKLRDYKADYNSADWEQMEAMLPQKSSRRVYYYSAAALLLLLLGSLGLWIGMGGIGNSDTRAVVVQKETPGLAGNNSEQVSVKKSDNAGQSGNTAVKTTEGQYEQSLSPAISEQVTHEKIFNGTEQAKTSPEQVIQKEERQLKARSFDRGGVKKEEVIIQERTAVNTDTEVSPKMPVESKISQSESASVADERNVAVAMFEKLSDEVSSTGSARSSNESESFTPALAETAGYSKSSPEYLDEVFALNRIESGLLRADDEEATIRSVKEALNGDALPSRKPKKQIVSFVMGAGAGMNFSFTDPALITKPGYSIDVAEELMFIKRIGIALSQSYVDRRYDGGAYPCPEGVEGCPYAYSSSVKSVDFGIDVKATLVNKARWSWYVKAGVVNTVKIKENFSYSYPEIDTITPPPTTTLPPQTNFNGTSMDIMFESQSLSLTADAIPAPDLTISGVKRYHLAYHAATGFDIALTPIIKMQLEAGHTFTQPIVGDANNRLHSFGVNGKMLFRLGR